MALPNLIPASFDLNEVQAKFAQVQNLKLDNFPCTHISVTPGVRPSTPQHGVTVYYDQATRQLMALNEDGTATPLTPAIGGAFVTSVFGRTGAVVAANGDYSFAQLSGSVSDGQLSSNVALLNRNAQVFSGTYNQFVQVGIGVAPSYALHVNNSAFINGHLYVVAGGNMSLSGASSFATTIRDSSGVMVFSTGSADRVKIDSAGNFGIGGSSFGGGTVVTFISNATADPTSNPTGGGILYVSAGALKYRGSSGTVTTIAAA